MTHISVTDTSEVYYPVVNLPEWTVYNEPPLGNLGQYLAMNE